MRWHHRKSLEAGAGKRGGGNRGSPASACSDVYAATEVWQGGSPVAYTKPYGGPPNQDELSHAAQQIVLERELLLRDSRTCLADSRRLLAELRYWTVEQAAVWTRSVTPIEVPAGSEHRGLFHRGQ